jgi:hypothetical protein
MSLPVVNKPINVVLGSARSSGTVRGIKHVQKADFFVTKLEPTTTASHVESYLKDRGITTQCTSLKTKYNTYSSFLVSTDRRFAQVLVSPDTWPEDVLVKIILPQARSGNHICKQFVNNGKDNNI